MSSQAIQPLQILVVVSMCAVGLMAGCPKQTPQSAQSETPNDVAPQLSADSGESEQSFQQAEDARMAQLELTGMVPPRVVSQESIAALEAISESELDALDQQQAEAVLAAQGIEVSIDYLVEACLYSQERLFDLLIAAGIDINLPHENGTALTAACFSGNPVLVEKLLNLDADLGTGFNENDMHPLQWATIGGNAECVELLLSHGVDVDRQDRLQRTALTMAVETNDLAMVSLLLKHGAKADIPDINARVALHRAVRSASLDIIKLLVETGVEINPVDTDYHATPLFDALMFKRTDVFWYLLGAGADPMIATAQGMTGLHAASRAGDIEVMTYFLDEQKMDIDVEDIRGGTPLMMALESPETTVDYVAALLERGADVNKRVTSHTPILLASVLGRADLVPLLIEKGADYTAMVEPGEQTVIHLAAIADSPELIHYFAKLDLDLAEPDGDGATPLELAEGSEGFYAAVAIREELGLPMVEYRASGQHPDTPSITSGSKPEDMQQVGEAGAN